MKRVLNLFGINFRIILTVFFVFSGASYSYAFMKVLRPSFHMGQKNGENCGMQSTNGSASQLNEINCMINPESCIHRTAWYGDRDNSLSEVSSDEGVGAAMAIVFSHRGIAQAVQVCDGIYLSNAHVLIDPPVGKAGNGAMWAMSSYPLSGENRAELPDPSTFISPRKDNPDAWRDVSKDYVFFKVDNPPNKVSIRPVRGSDEQVASGSFDTTLYRPRTRYQENPDGTPNFNTDRVGGAELLNIFRSPYKVNQPCGIFHRDDSSVMDTDCPTENGVSGSPYTLEAGGESYLVGLHFSGDESSYEKFEDDPVSNGFIQSSHFCEDYESVCGKPCAELSEVLHQ